MIRTTILLFAFFALTGCAALTMAREFADKLLVPDDDGKSNAVELAENARPFLPPPYGEIGLAGMIALQNAWLAAKKLEQRKNGAKKEG